jgi:transposase-like protein
MNERSRESSALAYLISKESYIMPTAFEREAALLKQSIRAGRLSGISFPDEAEVIPTTPKTRRREQRVFTDPERLEMVKDIAKERLSGKTMNEALSKHDLSSHTYTSWCRKFNMGFVKYDKKEVLRLDNLVLALLNKGMSITAACKKVGIRSDTFGVRTINNGSRKAVKRMKMTKGHIVQIKAANALRGQGSTLKDALVVVGISEANYRRYSERMKFDQ